MVVSQEAFKKYGGLSTKMSLTYCELKDLLKSTELVTSYIDGLGTKWSLTYMLLKQEEERYRSMLRDRILDDEFITPIDN